MGRMRGLSASKWKGTTNLEGSGTQGQHPGGNRGWRCQCLTRPSACKPAFCVICVCVYMQLSRLQSSSAEEKEQDGAIHAVWGCVGTPKDLSPRCYADLRSRPRM